MRADELVEDHWYRVRLPVATARGAPDDLRGVTYPAGTELRLVWRGPSPDGTRWKGGARVPTAGTFWTDYDVDGAYLFHFDEVEVLEEVPDPLRRR